MNAQKTHEILSSMWALVQPVIHATAQGGDSVAAVWDVLHPTDLEALHKLEEQFWEYPDDLTKLVVSTYG